MLSTSQWRAVHSWNDVQGRRPYTPTYWNSSLSQSYRRNELHGKKKEEPMMNVSERSNTVFSPLVFSTAGGMGNTYILPLHAVYKRFRASILADKRNTLYSTALHWLRCRLTWLFPGYDLQSCTWDWGSRTTFHWQDNNQTESIDVT